MSKKKITFNDITIDAHTYNNFGGGVIINWSEEGFGFGQICLENNNGKVRLSTELMNKEFVKAVLCALVDQSDLC